MKYRRVDYKRWSERYEEIRKILGNVGMKFTNGRLVEIEVDRELTERELRLLEKIIGAKFIKVTEG